MIRIHTKRKLSFSNPKGDDLVSVIKIKNKLIEVETKEQKKPLYLVMQSIWFKAIVIGDKSEEYRDGTDFYKSRLCNRDKTGKILSYKNYKTAILQEGDHKGAKRLIIEVKKLN